MRTIDSAIATIQGQDATPFALSLVARKEWLQWADFTAQSVGTLDTAIPQAYVTTGSGTRFYAAYRRTNGDLRVTTGLLDTASDWSLAQTSTLIASSSEKYVMRPAWLEVYSGGAWSQYLYVVAPSTTASVTLIRRALINGTSNPLSYSWENLSPEVPAAWLDTTDVVGGSRSVRRIEAIIPISLSLCIVVVARHNSGQACSELSFYAHTGTSVYALRTRIDVPMAQGDIAPFQTAAWYQLAPHTAIATGTALPDGGALIVVNGHTSGMPLGFTLRNGVESPVRAITPTTPSAGFRFQACDVRAGGNGAYYLSGRYTEVASDGTTTGFDALLISRDGENWSFGDRGFLVQAGASFGTFLIPRAGSHGYVYYGGNGIVARAPVNEVVRPDLAASLDLSSNVESWSLDQTANTADQFEALVSDHQNTLPISGHMIEGATLLVSANRGQLNAGDPVVNSAIGQFAIDEAGGDGYDDAGPPSRHLVGRDVAAQALLDTDAPCDLDLVGGEYAPNDLYSLDALIVKSPADRDYRCNATERLRYAGLNEPLVVWLDNANGRNGLVKMSVLTTPGSGSGHLPIIGFVVGAGDGAAFYHLALVYGDHAWSGHTRAQPEVRRTAFPAVDVTQPDKDGTGYNFTRYMMTVRETTGETTALSVADAGTNIAQASYTLPANTTVNLAMRKFGGRVQVFAKSQDYSVANCANQATYSLILEFDISEQLRVDDLDHARLGILLEHDTWGSVAAFDSSEYDDLEMALTDAGNTTDFTNLAYDGHLNGNMLFASSTTVILNPNTPNPPLTVGMYIRIVVNTGDDQIRRIVSIAGDGGSFVINQTMYVTAPSGHDGGYIYTQANGAEWGFADCGSKTFQDYAGNYVLQDPQASKLGRQAQGEAAFISNDNTAISPRKVSTDGKRFSLLTGSIAETKMGWDNVNPIPQNVGRVGADSSDPSVWRVVYRHSGILTGTAAAQGLPNGVSVREYLKVEDEVIRYWEQSYLRRGMSVQDTRIEIPTFFLPLSPANAGATTLSQWNNGGGVYPGADPATITNVAGLLAEISSRSAVTMGEDSAQYYVASAASHQVTLDKPYPNALVDREGLLVLSGRGQFGTRKVKHEATAACVKFPCDSNGLGPTISVLNLDSYTGRYLSVQDALTRMAALAGVKRAAFRHLWTSLPSSSLSVNLSTTPYTLPCGPLSNFVLDADVHIGGNSTDGGGAITSAKTFSISFRNYYRLVFTQRATGADYQAGRDGILSVGLATTQNVINAGSDGVRWLERAHVPISDLNLSGTRSGGGLSWTLTEDARTVKLRVIVNDGLVIVEANGQHVWTFNLTRFVGASGTFDSRAADVVQVYADAASTATFSMPELWQPVDRLALQIESPAMQGVQTLLDMMNAKFRSTADGGIEFGRFNVRDDLGTFTNNLFADVGKAVMGVQAPHVRAHGDVQFGSAIDVAWAQAHGYAFAGVNSARIFSSDDARKVAALKIRDGKESAVERTVASVGFLQAQPEDKLAIGYGTGSDDLPYKPSTAYVLSGIKFTGDRVGCDAEMKIRGFAT